MRIVRLTENDLKKMIIESVNAVMCETSYSLSQSSYNNRMDPSRKASDAMLRKAKSMVDPEDPNYDEKVRLALKDLKSSQLDSFRNGSINSFNREYGLNIKDVPNGSKHPSFNVGDISKPFYGAYNNNGGIGVTGGRFGDEGYEEMYGETTGPWNDENMGGPGNYKTYPRKDLSVMNGLKYPQLKKSIKRGGEARDKAHQN